MGICRQNKPGFGRAACAHKQSVGKIDDRLVGCWVGGCRSNVLQAAWMHVCVHGISGGTGITVIDNRVLSCFV